MTLLIKLIRLIHKSAVLDIYLSIKIFYHKIAI
jgi:hypothetical protein